MPYTKDDLSTKHSISIADVDSTLRVLKLPEDCDSYSEGEEKDFDKVRSFFRDGKVNDYDKASVLFNRDVSEVKKTTSSPPSLKKQGKHVVSDSLQGEPSESEVSPLNEEKMSNIAELLSQVKEITGTRVSLSEAAKILSVCGLDERDYYSPTDSKRFIEACKLFRENRPTVANIIGDAAALSEDGLLDLVEKVTGKRAENIPEMVNQIYIQKVSEQLEDSKSKIQDFYAGLEEQVLARIEGKSRRRSIMEAAWIPNLLNTSPEKPMVLPPELESPTTVDLTSDSKLNDEP